MCDKCADAFGQAVAGVGVDGLMETLMASADQRAWLATLLVQVHQ